jgi:hypothetical protein
MTRSVNMGPNEAYKAAQGLKSLKDAGKVLVVVQEEVILLDDLEPAAIATASVADGAVTSVKLATGAVIAGKVADGGISSSAQLAAGVVDSVALGSASVLASKMAFFKSSEQTGTGASQDIAHGLATTPGLVMIQVTAVASATDTFVEGVHDATNVKVTASVGAKFKVVAIK